MTLRFSKIITRSFPGFLRLAERAWKWREEQRSAVSLLAKKTWQRGKIMKFFAGAIFIFIIAHNYLYFVAFAFDNWKINSKSQRVPAFLCDLK